ncbi:MAG: hypothetical protein ACFB0B_15475 [Thermonemataceae bacterium]
MKFQNTHSKSINVYTKSQETIESLQKSLDRDKTIAKSIALATNRIDRLLDDLAEWREARENLNKNKSSVSALIERLEADIARRKEEEERQKALK